VIDGQQESQTIELWHVLFEYPEKVFRESNSVPQWILQFAPISKQANTAYFLHERVAIEASTRTLDSQNRKK
jgi:hypothetical protein